MKSAIPPIALPGKAHNALSLANHSSKKFEKTRLIHIRQGKEHPVITSPVDALEDADFFHTHLLRWPRCISSASCSDISPDGEQT